ncbi:MAG: hypothetical protein EOO16_00345 [Chitinophagaceae bacterium]|nr:MAG: hypothetical protein EOO16_00345 [Chitinophagaceae bacterium]
MFDFKENNFELIAEYINLKLITELGRSRKRLKEEGWVIDGGGMDDFIPNPGLDMVSYGFTIYQESTHSVIYFSFSNTPNYNNMITFSASAEKNRFLKFSDNQEISQISPQYVDNFVKAAISSLLRIPELPDELDLDQYTTDMLQQ